jgi:hypothetical protein
VKRKTCKTCKGKPRWYRCWFCDEANLAAQQTPDPSGWPVISDAMAVFPDQVPAERAEAYRRGVPTEFTPKGQPIFASAGHRAAYCRAMGAVDRNGGYRDYTGRSGVSEEQAQAREERAKHDRQMVENFLNMGGHLGK